MQDEFLRAVTTGKHRHTQMTSEMAVIRLYDAWARFCRELIILSAFGRTVTLGGIRLIPCHPTIKRCHMVIPLLLSTYKRKRFLFEPRWADANECIDAATRLRIVNLPTVSSALSAFNSPANDIRRARNFYAHRGKKTAQEALATGLFANPIRPDSFDLAAYITGNVRIVESWVNNLVLVATAASQ